MKSLQKTCTRTGIAICVLCLFSTLALNAQNSDHIGDGIASVATIAAETGSVATPQDSLKVPSLTEELPVWKQKLYYGYNFDIYYHQNSRTNRKENGWSITLEPEIGWRLKERIYLGLRLGGSYQDAYITYTFEEKKGQTTSEVLRIRQGSWSVTPYVRYRLKTLFNDKVGIWLEAHAFTGMEFPNVIEGAVAGTDYAGLRHSVIYGAQISPVITYQFNRKRTFQIFFSILSLGYSGTTYFYGNPVNGNYKEYTNDVIVFSGKLRNLLSNQFTPGLYGLKFGIQKSF